MKTREQIQKRIDQDEEWFETGKLTLESCNRIKGEIEALKWVLK